MTPAFAQLCKIAFNVADATRIGISDYAPASPPVEQPAPEGKSFMGVKDDSLPGMAMDFIPGVSTVYSGGKAIRDFSQGNIWGGLGNTAFAALGLVPFAGGIAKGVGRIGKLIAGAGRPGKYMQQAATKWNTVNQGGRQLMKANIAPGVNWLNKGQGLNMGLRTGQIKTTGALTAGGMGASMMDTPKPAPTAPPTTAQAPPGQFYANPNAGATAMGEQWGRQVYGQKMASAWRTLQRAGI